MSHECHQTFEGQRNEASEGQEISVREYSDPVEDSIRPRRNSSGSSSSDNNTTRSQDSITNLNQNYSWSTVRSSEKLDGLVTIHENKR